MRVLLTLSVLLSGAVAHAAPSAEPMDFQSPGAPGYVDPSVDSRERRETLQGLPSIPERDDSGAAPAGQMLGVSEVRVEGVTVLPRSRVESIVSRVEGRRVPIEELNAIRLELTRAYVDAGYLNSGVVIPDQDVSEGTIVMRAIEGSLAGIEYEREPILRRGYIERRLGAERDPLDVAALQEALRRLQRDPMIERLDAALTPGDELGESILHLALEEAPRFEIGASVDNYQPLSLGSERGQVFLRSQNLTGYGEVLRFGGSVSEGSDGYNGSLEVPVTAAGTRARVYYNEADSKIVEDRFEALNIESRTRTMGASVEHPVHQGTRHIVSLSLGLELKHSESTLDGSPFRFSPGDDADGEADTTGLLLGADWTRRGEGNVMNLRGTIRRGLTLFDPTRESPDVANPAQLSDEVNGEFTLFFLQGVYIERLNEQPLFEGLDDRAQLVVRSTFQKSFDPLLSLEKVPVGGVNTVRGYPENLMIRDNAFAATVEMQLPFFGYRSTPHPLNLVVAPFVDLGIAWDESATFNALPGVRDTSEQRSIVGIGVGLLWKPMRGLDANIFFAEDFADTFSEGDDLLSVDREDSLQTDGVHFSVTYRRRF